MPTPTYTQLNSITLAASASDVTFSNIPQTYKDLVLIMNFTGDSFSCGVQFNNDTASNYYDVYMYGNSWAGVGAGSGNRNYALFTLTNGTGNNNSYLLNIMDYSAVDKHKMVLNRTNHTGGGYNWVDAWVNRWASTSAISTLKVMGSSGSYPAGTTISLYGIVG